jgi:hypothetical protein
MTTRYWAALATILVVALGVLSWLASPRSDRDLSVIFTPEHVTFLGMHDTRDQQRTYRIVVVAVTLISLAAAVRFGKRTAWRSLIAHRLERIVCAIDAGGAILVISVVAVLLYFYLGTLPGRNFQDLQGEVFSIAFIPSPRTYLATLAVALLLLLALARFADGLKAPGVGRAIWIVIASYATFLMLPGLFEAPNLSRFSPELHTGVEWHYAGGLGPADRLAAGHRLFSEVQLYSGPLLVTLLAIAERMLGHFSFGAHIRIVQVLQSVFLVTMLAAQWRWLRSRPLAILAGFLLVAPWVHSHHAAVLYPNQSAWRSLGFPLGVLALLLLGRRQTTASRIGLGACAGLLVLLNVEIGVCITAGYLVFLVATANSRRAEQAFRIGAAFGAGLALAATGFVALFRAGLGYWPIPSSFQDALLLIVRFSSGYAALPLEIIESFPLLVCVHAIYLVIRSALQWAKGPLPFRSAFKGAIGTVMLLWFAYYVRAPHFWNFWTFLFLYGLLVADYLDPRLLSVFWRRLPRLSYAWRPLILALVILPGILLTNVGAIDAVGRGVSRLVAPPRHTSHVVSGVQLPEEFARSLLRKAASLQALHRRHPDDGVVYFTANSYMLPLLASFYSRLPFQDTFFETITNHDFERLVSWTIALAPDVILFDSSGSPLAGYREQQRFFGRLRAAFTASYESTLTAEGWEVWERTVRAAGRGGQPPPRPGAL